MRGDSLAAGIAADVKKWWPLVFIGPAAAASRVPSHWFSGTWLVGTVALILCLQLLFFRRSLNGKYQVTLIWAFVAWLAVSLLWTPEIAGGLELLLSIGTASLAFTWAVISGPPSGGTRLHIAGLLGIVVAGSSLIAADRAPLVDGFNPDRVLAMAVVASLLAAWYGPRSRSTTALVGIAALAIVLASGSRMAAAVLVLLLVSAPGLRLGRAGRVLVAMCLGVLGLAAMTTEPFQQRWFVDGEGGIIELFDISTLNSSGRFAVWPEVAEQCGFTVFGHGAGAAGEYSSEIRQTFFSPHNEYLRIWCDTGLVGSLLLWGPMLVLFYRSTTSRQAPNDSWSVSTASLGGFALLLLAMTDNPLSTPIAFLIPLALFFGWAASGDPRRMAERT